MMSSEIRTILLPGRTSDLKGRNKSSLLQPRVDQRQKTSCTSCLFVEFWDWKFLRFGAMASTFKQTLSWQQESCADATVGCPCDATWEHKCTADYGFGGGKKGIERKSRCVWSSAEDPEMVWLISFHSPFGRGNVGGSLNFEITQVSSMVWTLFARVNCWFYSETLNA